MPALVNFLRRSLRPFLIGVLLLLIWKIVLPYQAAVRIDQALSNWAQTQPDVQMIRAAQQPFDRSYQLHWHPDGAQDLLILNLELHTQPPILEQGRWIWGRLVLTLDARSPWQIRHWNGEPLRVAGQVTGLGQWQFQLSPAGEPTPTEGLNAIRSADTGEWRFEGNLPGLMLTQGQHALWLGRSQWLLRQYRTPPTDRAEEPWLDSLQGNLHIRRLGWRWGDTRGQLDHLDVQMSSEGSRARRLSGFFGLMARQIVWTSAPLDPPRDTERAALGTALDRLHLTSQWRGTDDRFYSALGQVVRSIADSIATQRHPFQHNEPLTLALDALCQSIGTGSAWLDSTGGSARLGSWRLEASIPGADAAAAVQSGLSAQLTAQGAVRAELMRRLALPALPAPDAPSGWQIQYHSPHWHIQPLSSHGAAPDAHALPAD
ncbi:hypothetical protein [Halothiobacillus sp. DCM-1]|uniref:hypothetical protein n=1 Tax=Halothiobacillus sp. DCM-1 TaxID=3112558 RepID=UPI003251508D